MLFRRRHQVSLWERLRVCLWPRRSFSRSFRYMGKRIVRISGSPHAIALGLAIGVYASFTPFFGLHIIIAVLVAWGLSANIAAAAIGTAFSNPLTMPFIFGTTYALGRTFWSIDADSEPISFVEFFQMLEQYDFSGIGEAFFQALIGAAILGGIFGVVAYFLAFNATWRFRRARALKLKMARRYPQHFPKSGNRKKEQDPS